MKTLAVVSVLGACVQVPTVAYRSAIDEARPAIARGEHATIAVIDDPESDEHRTTFDLAPDQQIEVSVAGKPTTITLANYYARCKPDHGPCDLDDDRWVTVDWTREANPTVVHGVIGGVFAAGLAVCTFACDRPWNYAAGGALALGVVIAIVWHELSDMSLPIGR